MAAELSSAVTASNAVKSKSRCMQKPLSAVAFLAEGSWVVERCTLKICGPSASLASASPEGRSNGHPGNANVSAPQATNSPQPALKKSAQGYENKQVSCQQLAEGSETLRK